MDFACRASILASLALIVSMTAAGCSGSGGDNDDNGAGGSAGSAGQGGGGKSGTGGASVTTGSGGSSGNGNSSGGNGNGSGGNGAGGTSPGGNGGSANNGGTGGTYTVQQGDPVQAADFPHAYAVALCAKKAECCELQAETLPDDCVTQIEDFITTTYHEPSLAAGASFDAEQAGDCIATMPTWPCGIQNLAEDFAAEAFGNAQALFPDLGTTSTGMNLCGAYGHGTLAAGSTCNIDSECAQPDGTWGNCGIVCYQDPTTKAGSECEGSHDCAAPLGCRNGVCAAPSGEGGPCDSNVDCDSATRCDLETFSCVPREEEGGFCERDADCVAGLQCSSLTALGTCVSVGGLGAPCSNAKDCSHELWCSGDPDVDGSGTGTCQADFGLGESCLDESQCGDGNICGTTCESWLTCYVRY